MSFQAYLDAIEDKTGLAPIDLVERARDRGYDDTTKAQVIIDWLKEDHGLGRGHAMALVHVIKKGPTISDTHVGTDGVHRDESTELDLRAKRDRASPERRGAG